MCEGECARDECARGECVRRGCAQWGERAHSRPPNSIQTPAPLAHPILVQGPDPRANKAWTPVQCLRSLCKAFTRTSNPRARPGILVQGPNPRAHPPSALVQGFRSSCKAPGPLCESTRLCKAEGPRVNPTDTCANAGLVEKPHILVQGPSPLVQDTRPSCTHSPPRASLRALCKLRPRVKT